MAQSERVRRMTLEFMTWHNKGYSIKEIAEIYGLSEVTVYNYLEDIAKANKCTREELLIKVRKKPTLISQRIQEREARTGFAEVTEKLHEAENLIKETIECIDRVIEQEEK